MTETGQDTALPQRVPGAAGTSPRSPVALALPEELRQRLRAAVRAELGQEAGEDQRGDALEPRAAAEPQVGGGPQVGGEPQVGREGEVAHGSWVPEIDAWWGPEKRRRAPARLIAVGLAVIAIIGSLTAFAVSHFSASPAAVRAQAAAWVAEQVSPAATVACDPVMCAALRAQHFPASDLVVLGPASPEPVTSAVVIETAAVRQQFGTSLGLTWAPAILASFGSGGAAVSVRAVAPHGAAAYQAAGNAERASSAMYGAELLSDSRVTVSATARSQLRAGQVDSRLLQALVSVAGQEPVSIARFGSLGPGASPGVPLGFADLAEKVPAAHLDTAAYARAVWAALNGPDAQIRPARAISETVQGQPILQVEFSEPSPLGNLGPASS